MEKAGMLLPPAGYPPELISNGYCLSEIPDFQGLLPKAYDAGVPVFELTDDEIRESGPVLEGMRIKRKAFLDQFEELSDKIIKTLVNV